MFFLSRGDQIAEVTRPTGFPPADTGSLAQPSFRRFTTSYVAALKQARLAVAMGSGSQITKGIADIVLLKDEFANV